jgi:aryl-alcohol dehydrogenase-like predicted oxidoreductase/spore coat polysaccharide biosynthesis protein SpsF (cytidylyltransferase family)
VTTPRRVVAVLQARTSSSRLPAKVLLPVRGVPVAVLAALRAGRGGAEVRLATSVDPTDDVLAETAAGYGLPVIRGSLEDPLARFVAATDDLADRDLVVRLTADNVVPDSAMVAEVAAELIRRDVPYLRTAPPQDGLPYGVGAEVFTVEALRAAHTTATDAADREHVTPWIRTKLGDAVFDRYAHPDRWSHLRATIDSFADYHRIGRVFAGVEDPVAIGWQELCDRLDTLPDAPIGRLPIREAGGQPQSSLVLGTAQLGMNYGAANLGGLPDPLEAREVIVAAVAHGITHFDTARAYGLAEERIGRYLDEGHRPQVRVVTKLRPLDGLDPDATPGEVGAATDASVFRSLAALGGRTVDALLLHRLADATRAGGAVWRHLLEHRDAGLIGRLGVSVSSPAEAMTALADESVRYIQLPFNLLDTRWDEVAERAPARPDVTLVARSALLQGLLGGVPADRWPVNAGIDVPALMGSLAGLAAELGRADVIDLCLGYVRSQPWLHATVVGTEHSEQVRDLCRRFRTPLLTPAERARVREALPAAPVDLLDPSRWTFAR